MSSAAPTPFRVPYAPPDEQLVAELLTTAKLPAAAEARIDAQAMQLIAGIRDAGGGIGSIEDLLREYSLATKEGLALMVLAEALLRVPDSATADQLIEDKLAVTNWSERQPQTSNWLATASGWALGLSSRVIQPGETPEGILAGMVKRLGQPTVRVATRQAMRLMGNHFVLGETIAAALDRARKESLGGRIRYSFDMLGEGARTAEDARHYLEAYSAAIVAIGRSNNEGDLPDRPGISVKLSALHPRYEAISQTRVMAELVPQVISLAQAAKAHRLNFTIDAEEADRLELSLDIIAAVLADASLADWPGFGLAIQAYQKRSRAVIDWVAALARHHDRRLMVRLVKGAYWDSEVKRTQERGLDDYPVFTRKAATDLNYLACAERLLAARPYLYPQFATHNALTIASIIERAGGTSGYEFQRLHGMGEAAYKRLLASDAQASVRVYAPVGSHRELLAYLVRRLLENGANSSFVSMAGDPRVPVSDLLKRPAAIIGSAASSRARGIPMPADLFGTERRNSSGVEFGHAESLARLTRHVNEGLATHPVATAIIDGEAVTGVQGPVLSPIDGSTVAGVVTNATPEQCDAALTAAISAGPDWASQTVSARAACLERAADAIEAERYRLIALLQLEAGKTLDDALAEVREAVDFCRYYAQTARQLFGTDTLLPGPTGEDNRLRWRPRGVFVCISPWNFPLAIFAGQVAAALVAGNSVIAKPAPQTPLIAAATVRLLHSAGVPTGVLHLLPGGGDVGARLVSDTRTAGVAFTGSTQTAWTINRTLAARDCAIAPFIAETGGINAMIVDATALPEQVADDVVTSAFRSAGQRCSALRLLCVQTDVADKMIAMIAGAARELAIGDPREPATHVGPVIDAAAQARLLQHIAAMQQQARVHLAESKVPTQGFYVAPHMFELPRVTDLKREVFGPILHVVRWQAEELDQLIADIAASGFGLTLGVHSRIDGRIEQICAGLPTGNIYINRNMIGAVVGSQPFGGCGLSGTGPKAGGPHYLQRFAHEQVITVNTAAAGGNAALLGGEIE